MMEEYLKEFGDIKIENVTRIGYDYYQAKEELILTTRKVSHKPSSLGLYLGRDNGREFEPSIALIEIISKQSDKKAIVDEKAEWLFLCGRDIFQDSIKKMKATVGFVLVQNLKDENLGLAKISKKQKLMLKNVLDKGDFLRRERRN